MKNIYGILNNRKSKKHLLLGNGFSIAVWDEFKNNFMSNEDFKMIVKKLLNDISFSVENKKESIEGVLRLIKELYFSLKKNFIDEMINKHPNYINVKPKLEKMEFFFEI